MLLHFFSLNLSYLFRFKYNFIYYILKFFIKRTVTWAALLWLVSAGKRLIVSTWCWVSICTDILLNFCFVIQEDTDVIRYYSVNWFNVGILHIKGKEGMCCSICGYFVFLYSSSSQCYEFRSLTFSLPDV